MVEAIEKVRDCILPWLGTRARMESPIEFALTDWGEA